MVGIGVHKRMIEHLLWSTWASGATCLMAGSDVADQLSAQSKQVSELLRRSKKIELKQEGLVEELEEKNEELEAEEAEQRNKLEKFC